MADKPSGKPKTGLDGVINLINKGAEYPALSLVKNDSQLAAMISKLVRGRETRKINPGDPNSFYNVNPIGLKDTSDAIQNRITDAENIMSLFPDMELSAQILTSSILSPKDMMKTDVLYTASEPLVGSELTSKLLEETQLYMNKEYGFDQGLYSLLHELLFETGSHVKVILPESTVDALINSSQAAQISTEDLSEIFTPDKKIVGMGFLGNPSGVKSQRSVGIESFFDRNISTVTHPEIMTSYDPAKKGISLGVEVSDNFKLLKLPEIAIKHSRARMRNMVRKQSVATESIATNQGFEAALYKNMQTNAKPFVTIPTPDKTVRRSVCKPLVLKWPSEAVLPVTLPGDETKHIGYMVMIDEEGNPVSRMSTRNQMNDLTTNLSDAQNSIGSFLLEKSRRNLKDQQDKTLRLPEATKIFGDIIESDLMDRLQNGALGRKARIARSEEVYQIMLARSFANQYTRLVFVPEELVTYYALKYYENGVGKSLLDDLRTLTSIRAIILFARVMAMTKSAINVTHVNMEIDPNDPDPQKTVTLATHEIIKMRQQYFPLGINNPIDLMDWVQRAGLEFTFTGHPGLPQTKFDFETKNLQHTVPDDALDEMLRKMSIMAIGLSPEQVDNGFSAEFATTIVQNNILLSKRVSQIQDLLTPLITDNARKIARNDIVLREKLKAILKENRADVEKSATEHGKKLLQDDEAAYYDALLDEFIEVMVLGLPKPDTTSVDTLSAAYSEYSDSLDKALESWVDGSFITENVAGEMSGSIDTIKATIRAYFLRKWQSENGYMTELNSITTIDETGQPSIDLKDIMTSHIEGLIRGSVNYLKSLAPIQAAANNDLQNMGASESDAAGSGASSFSTDSSSSDDGSTDEGGGDGGDDMGGLGDLGF